MLELYTCLMSDLNVQGEDGTFDYRLFMTEDGEVASFWHDIPLDNGDGTVNFVCEIPKETKAKMEVATVSRAELLLSSGSGSCICGA